MTAPPWLTQRGGELKLGSDRSTWYVVFDKKPHYGLVSVPAGSTFGCVIKQTENGTRIDSPGTHPTAEAAVAGGLEDLRKALGWG